jgi:hypothetical protein
LEHTQQVQTHELPQALLLQAFVTCVDLADVWSIVEGGAKGDWNGSHAIVSCAALFDPCGSYSPISMFAAREANRLAGSSAMITCKPDLCPKRGCCKVWSGSGSGPSVQHNEEK